jgi:hypothetical protein
MTEFVAECADNSSAQPGFVQRARSDHTETTIKNTFLLKKSILLFWRACLGGSVMEYAEALRIPKG